MGNEGSQPDGQGPPGQGPPGPGPGFGQQFPPGQQQQPQHGPGGPMMGSRMITPTGPGPGPRMMTPSAGMMGTRMMAPPSAGPPGMGQGVRGPRPPGSAARPIPTAMAPKSAAPMGPPEVDLSQLSEEERAIIANVMARAQQDTVAEPTEREETPSQPRRPCPLCHSHEVALGDAPGPGQECVDCKQRVCGQCGGMVPSVDKRPEWVCSSCVKRRRPGGGRAPPQSQPPPTQQQQQQQQIHQQQQQMHQQQQQMHQQHQQQQPQAPLSQQQQQPMQQPTSQTPPQQQQSLRGRPAKQQVDRIPPEPIPRPISRTSSSEFHHHEHNSTSGRTTPAHRNSADHREEEQSQYREAEAMAREYNRSEHLIGSRVQESPDTASTSKPPVNGRKKEMMMMEEEEEEDDEEEEEEEDELEEDGEESDEEVLQPLPYYDHSPGEVYTIPEEEDEAGSPTAADGVTPLRLKDVTQGFQDANRRRKSDERRSSDPRVNGNGGLLQETGSQNGRLVDAEGRPRSLGLIRQQRSMEEPTPIRGKQEQLQKAPEAQGAGQLKGPQQRQQVLPSTHQQQQHPPPQSTQQQQQQQQHHQHQQQQQQSEQHQQALQQMQAQQQPSGAPAQKTPSPKGKPKSIDLPGQKKPKPEPQDWSPVTDLSPIMDVSPSVEAAEQAIMERFQERAVQEQQQYSSSTAPPLTPGHPGGRPVVTGTISGMLADFSRALGLSASPRPSPTEESKPRPGSLAQVGRQSSGEQPMPPQQSQQPIPTTTAMQQQQQQLQQLQQQQLQQLQHQQHQQLQQLQQQQQQQQQQPLQQTQPQQLQGGVQQTPQQTAQLPGGVTNQQQLIHQQQFFHQQQLQQLQQQQIQLQQQQQQLQLQQQQQQLQQQPPTTTTAAAVKRVHRRLPHPSEAEQPKGRGATPAKPTPTMVQALRKEGDSRKPKPAPRLTLTNGQVVTQDTVTGYQVLESPKTPIQRSMLRSYSDTKPLSPNSSPDEYAIKTTGAIDGKGGSPPVPVSPSVSMSGTSLAGTPGSAPQTPGTSARDRTGDSSDTQSEADSSKSSKIRRKLPPLPADQEPSPMPTRKSKQDRSKVLSAQERARAHLGTRQSSLDGTSSTRTSTSNIMSLARSSASESNLRKISMSAADLVREIGLLGSSADKSTTSMASLLSAARIPLSSSLLSVAEATALGRQSDAELYGAKLPAYMMSLKQQLGDGLKSATEERRRVLEQSDKDKEREARVRRDLDKAGVTSGLTAQQRLELHRKLGPQVSLGSSRLAQLQPRKARHRRQLSDPGVPIFSPIKEDNSLEAELVALKTPYKSYEFESIDDTLRREGLLRADVEPATFLPRYSSFGTPSLELRETAIGSALDDDLDALMRRPAAEQYLLRRPSEGMLGLDRWGRFGSQEALSSFELRSGSAMSGGRRSRKPRSWHPSPYVSEDEDDQLCREEKKKKIKAEIARRRRQIEENARLHEELVRLAKMRENAPPPPPPPLYAAPPYDHPTVHPELQEGGSVLRSIDEILHGDDYPPVKTSAYPMYGGDPMYGPPQRVATYAAYPTPPPPPHGAALYQEVTPARRYDYSSSLYGRRSREPSPGRYAPLPLDEQGMPLIAATYPPSVYDYGPYDTHVDFSPMTTDTDTPTDFTPAMPLLPDMPTRSRKLLEDLGSSPITESVLLQQGQRQLLQAGHGDDRYMGRMGDGPAGVTSSGRILMRQQQRPGQAARKAHTSAHQSSQRYNFPIKRILLTRDPKERSVSGNGLGMKVIGGKEIPGTNGMIGAYVAKIYPGGVVDTLGEVKEGDQVLEWNGIPLTGKTYEEVQKIVSQSNGEIEMVIRSDFSMANGHSKTPPPAKPPRKSLSRNGNHPLPNGYPAREEPTYENIVDSYAPDHNGYGGGGRSTYADDRQVSSDRYRGHSSSHRPMDGPSDVVMDTDRRIHSPLSPEGAILDENPLYSQSNTPSLPTPHSFTSMSPKTERAGDKANKPDVPLGEIQLQVCYDVKAQILYVSILQARHLTTLKEDGDTRPDPFVKCYLLPGRSVENQRRTRYFSRSSCPEWKQTMVYPNVSAEELKQRYLEITVWNYDIYRPNEFLGEINLDLSDNSVFDEEPRWYQLQDHIDDGHQLPTYDLARPGAPSTGLHTHNSETSLSSMAATGRRHHHHHIKASQSNHRLLPSQSSEDFVKSNSLDSRYNRRRSVAAENQGDSPMTHTSEVSRGSANVIISGVQKANPASTS